jgi:AcrR family transcriptional regulator
LPSAIFYNFLPESVIRNVNSSLRKKTPGGGGTETPSRRFSARRDNIAPPQGVKMQDKKSRSYKSNMRREQAGQTKERIADAADALMKAKGYEKTSISAIAAEAGVSAQTVYAVFGSKQRLLVYLMTRTIDSDYDGYKREMAAELSTGDMAEKFAQLACHRHRKQCAANSAFGGLSLVYPELEFLADTHWRMRKIMFEEYLARLDKEQRSETLASPQASGRRLELMAALADGGLYHNLIVRAGWSQDLFEKILIRLFGEALKIKNLE